MRIDLKPQSYIYPEPVLIIGSYDEKGKPNAMNAAWGMISDYNQISICLAEHKTTSNILISKAFTVSMGTLKMLTSCDYVGIVSLNKDEKKMEKSGFTTTKSKIVNAPIINELPLAIECELVSFNEETGILVGKILNVSADESILTDGKIDPSKAEFITYDGANHTYIKLGEVVGKAFTDGLKLK